MLFRLRYAVRTTMLLALVSVATHGVMWGHGGEDHGDAAPATTPGASSNMLTTYAVTEVFELLLKYPPPEIGSDATLRFFLSDYATNRALDGSMELAFNPAGVTVVKAPALKAPGIFEAVVRFPADTVYSAVATVRSGRRTDFMELKNIYTGSHADHFLADHGGAVAPVASPGGLPWWTFTAPGALIVLLIAVAARRVRRRRRLTDMAGDDVMGAMDQTESKEQGI